MTRESHRRRNTNRELLLQLQHELYLRNDQLIQSYEQADGTDLSQYESVFAEDVTSFDSVSRISMLVKELTRARLTYVADYHTLKLAQKTFLKLAKRVRTKHLSLALEFFPADQQKSLDAYMAGRITEKTLLRRIRYRSRWQYDIWPHFKPIVDLAKARRWRLVGLDAPRHGGSTLAECDAFMAQVLVDHLSSVAKHARVMVLVGELHLARPHLPQAVSQLARRADLKGLRTLTIFQNVEPIYNQLVAEGRENDTEVVRLDPGRYCILNTPPAIVQQSYLNWIEYDVASVDYDKVEEDFSSVARHVAKTLGVSLRRRVDRMRIFPPDDPDFLAELQGMGLSAESTSEPDAESWNVRTRVLPRQQMVYLSNLSLNQVGEAAGRLLHCLEMGVDEEEIEGFHGQVIHEAIAFFGSKVVNPKRKCKRIITFRQLLGGVTDQAPNDPRALEVASAVCLHHRVEQGHALGSLSTLFRLPDNTRRQVQRALGRILGERLYYTYARDRTTRREMREIIRVPLTHAETASALYFSLVRRTSRVPMPRRL